MSNINKLVLATGNVGKIKEMTELLRPLQIEVIAQAQLNIPDTEEPGLTFIENAILKARHAARISGLPALADDSGLAVDALQGRPGIHSARYAGTPASTQKNIDKLLDEMKTVPHDKRQAQFHCVLALLTSTDDPTPIICDGIWRGTILQQPQGDGGFGYDPVFFVPSENKSAAQLSPEIKNKLSHRGKALNMLIQTLKESLDCHGRSS